MKVKEGEEEDSHPSGSIYTESNDEESEEEEEDDDEYKPGSG